MTLPLAAETRFGLQTRLPDPDETRRLVPMLEDLGYSSLSVGDHLSFAIPILDPLLQLAQVAAHARTLSVMTGVYLLPLRHPGPVAKQVSTLDRLAKGRFIFGVGVGGEFKSDFAVAGVPLEERGARLSEGVEVLRKLWTAEPVSHQGRFYSFPEVRMQPAPLQAGGPPIWFGGRSEAALKRCARLGDGYVSYVVTPQMYADALAKIDAAATAAGRRIERFGTAHLLFCQIGDTYEAAFQVANERLSVRYAMDFTKATQRYVALGTPEQVAAKIREFHAAGVRYFCMDFLTEGPPRDAQIERFARDVRPLLRDLG